MKYEVINLNTGRTLGKYLIEKMAQDHADYVNRHGGHAEVRRIK